MLAVYMMQMIDLNTFNSNLVPLIEGLWSSNPSEFEFSGLIKQKVWNRTDDLGIKSLSLRPTEPCLYVRSKEKNFWHKNSEMCIL